MNIMETSRRHRPKIEKPRDGESGLPKNRKDGDVPPGSTIPEPWQRRPEIGDNPNRRPSLSLDSVEK